ncbi:MAG: hypothetical protein Q9203_006975 [Teloschistes exilis]
MRLLHSFLLLVCALLLSPVTGNPQVTSAPALLATVGDGQGTAATAVAGCNGCQIIVDVAGVVWYSEVFLNTVGTVVASVNNGNGSRVTRTSTIINAGHFTFNPAAGTAAYGATPLAVTNAAYSSVTTIGGVPLTSPTAYNVFSAYTLSSQFIANGVCSSTVYTSTLPQAFTETLPQGGGQVTLDAAGQQQFITGFLGFSTCSTGGANIAASVLAPVSNITATTTMFGSGVALAAMTTMTLAPTTNPTPTSSLPLRTTTLVDVLTTLTATLRGSSTITPSARFTGSANAPNIVIGNLTITPNGNPINLPFIPGNATAITISTPGASGTGAVVTGNFTGGNTTIPFVGDAYSWRSGTSLWGSCLLVFLLAIGWIL